MKKERTDTRFATWLVLVAGLWGVLDTTAQSQTDARLDPVVNVFFKIDGIEGESTDSGHPGLIDVASLTYGVSRPAGADQKASHKGLTIVKDVDKASPFLYLHCSSGRTLDEVVLEITRTADNDISVQEFKMRNVTVTSVQASATSGSKRATERLTLHYESIAWTYVKVDPLTGSVISEVTMHWDLADDSGT